MTKAERTRRHIIERSAAIINKKGIAGTAISDLMEATKLAKGGIYGNFESKEEICGEAFTYLVTRISEGLDRATAGPQTAKEKLFALLDFYEGIALDTSGGCPLLNFGIEADDTNPELRALVIKSIKRSQQRMTKIIEDGQQRREIDKSVDAAEFAMKMFATIEGGIFATRVTNNKSVMKSIVSMLKKEIASSL